MSDSGLNHQNTFGAPCSTRKDSHYQQQKKPGIWTPSYNLVPLLAGMLSVDRPFPPEAHV
ncbi:hypothetical protein M430DRAFT_32888 [Amorphotheca resinae ATCC 22711]|uniref:Uncharacterized protein n=1 Tax=Amorphotheca resinae ATCC 22711 TaxID=857342 RepID=A0A2T3B9S0_AMORE|nr:hypothetical protein M430DRAFT_32888 [Amorphotheca resinae ATCC 22711]PSS25030.1 hypothetical protein M430DRAFT_32888 [Amorphotheca resinae ATCC 22711]